MLSTKKKMIDDDNALRIFITANDRIIQLKAMSLHHTITESNCSGILTV